MIGLRSGLSIYVHLVGTINIVNGAVLRSGASEVQPGDLVIDGATIRSVDESASVQDAVTVVDAADAWVLPGVIDIHGDAFERAIMPRAGVGIEVADGLAHNDAQLVAAGITTAFLSITDSWEPGLRSRSMLREIIDACQSSQGVVDRRIHIRHERCNTLDFDQLTEWITTGRVDMVSYNDHTPGGNATIGAGVSATQVGRSGVSETDLLDLQEQAIGQRAAGLLHDDQLAEVCRSAECPTASHDAHTDDDFDRDKRLGVRIAEFPTSIALAKRFLASGIDVLLGAPNLVRGGSHLGNLSVRDAIAAGAGNLLCSDYHYPSLLQAPFIVADLELADFGDAWAMVSANAAKAAGLRDRGRIEPGARADIIVVEPPSDGHGPFVRAVISNGSLVASYARPKQLTQTS